MTRLEKLATYIPREILQRALGREANDVARPTACTRVGGQADLLPRTRRWHQEAAPAQAPRPPWHHAGKQHVLQGISILQGATTRRGKLPEPQLVRMVTVVVDVDQADAVFDFIYEHARIGRPGGGMVLMAPLILATPFLMPAGVPNEAGEAIDSK